jgi:hypothetical protein
MIESFSEITSEKNHGVLFNKIIELCPMIAGFEKAGVLFKEPGKGIYSLETACGLDGKVYVKDTVHYTNIGLSGTWFTDTSSAIC